MFPPSGVLSQQANALGPFMTFQRVTGTFIDTSTSLTLTFGSLTDATQCVPLISGYTSDEGWGYTGTEDRAFTIDIWDDAGTVKATIARAAAGTTGEPEVYVSLVLIEFFAPINVYKYSYTGDTNGSPYYWDKTITSVTVANSFVIATGTGVADSSGTSQGMHTGARLTSSTNCRVYSVANTGTRNTILYVVEDPTGQRFSVTHTPVSLNSTTTTTDFTVPAHDESKTMCINAMCLPTTGGSYPNNTWPTLYTYAFYRQAPTNYRFHRYSTTAPFRAGAGTIQLITFLYGVSVQKDSFDFGTTNLIVDRTISSVTVANSFACDLFGTGLGSCSLQTGIDGGGFKLAKTLVRCHVLNSTQVRCQRNGYSTENNQLYGYQVVSLTF